ncbi:MAG: glycosyltransferase family 9 protein [Bdellovibrionia bacterium]
MSHLLLFKLGALGDLSFFLPCLDQIKRSDPSTQITWVVGHSYAPLLKAHPHVDQVISVDERALFQSGPFGLIRESLKLWRRLKASYDQIWIGHRSSFIFLLLRLRLRGHIFQIVRKRTRFLALLRTEVEVPPLTLHESLGFQRLCERALGRNLPKSQWQADYSWVPKPSVSLPTQYLVLHIGGGSNEKTEFRLKQWPHWSQLVDQLSGEEPDLPIILIGSKADQAQADLITQGSNRASVLNLVGKLNFLELIGVLKQATWFVGVDSGPLHFADALKVTCIGLYGPTSLTSWGLLNSHSLGLSQKLAC